MIVGSIILAGGRSRRMGQPKESLRYRDTTLLGHTVDTLVKCSFPIVVVARSDEQELPPFALEAEIVYDEKLDQGPLVGMKAGLQFLKDDCDSVFVTGCDNPFLQPSAVGWLADQLGDMDLVMAKIDDVLQPLGALYRVSVLSMVEELVAAGKRSPRRLAEHSNARILSEAEVDAFDPSRSFLRNVNTLEDYEAVLQRDENKAKI